MHRLHSKEGKAYADQDSHQPGQRENQELDFVLPDGKIAYEESHGP